VRRAFATWQLFERVFEDDTVHVGEMKMPLTKINNDIRSEDDEGSKDSYIL